MSPDDSVSIELARDEIPLETLEVVTGGQEVHVVITINKPTGVDGS
jgi:hypothetical protein